MMAYMIHGFINGGIDFRFGNSLHFLNGFIDTFPQAPGSFVSRRTYRSRFVDTYDYRFIVAKRTAEKAFYRIPGVRRQFPYSAQSCVLHGNLLCSSFAIRRSV
jgi:hypothetical protein